MKVPAYHPYRSAEAKEAYLTFYDNLSAKRWPFVSENRIVATAYGQTFMRISGLEGAQALVMLPGMGATSLLWAPNIEALSKGYRTYALDNIGDVGRSVCTKSIENAEDLVNWLDELFSALELGDNINLMGVSHGGWLTTQYALRFPKRLRKIVLLAPGATVLRTRLEFYLRGALVLTGRRYFAKSTLYWLLRI